MNNIKVKVMWEFEVDVEGLDPAFVDINRLAEDLTKRELECLLNNNELTSDDFDYIIA